MNDHHGLSCLKISSHVMNMVAVVMPHFLLPTLDQTLLLQQARRVEFCWKRFSKRRAQDVQQIEQGFLHNYARNGDPPEQMTPKLLHLCCQIFPGGKRSFTSITRNLAQDIMLNHQMSRNIKVSEIDWTMFIYFPPTHPKLTAQVTSSCT